MIRFTRLPVSLLLLLLVLFLSACGTREVYIVVTATPDPNATVPAAAPGEAESENPEEPTGPTAPTGATSVPSAETLVGGADPTLEPPPVEMGRIAFMGPYGEGGQIRSFLMNADGSGLRPVSEEFTESLFPVISPDGSQVLFAGNLNTDPDIFSMAMETGKSVNLTNSPGYDIQPAWSPDGKFIAFTSEREGGDVDLWVMEGDGNNPRRVAQTPGEDQLGSWSPDGERIAYSNKDELGESLWVVDVASGETTRLTENESGTDSAPAWSPDGETIAFYSLTTGGLPAIHTIRPDGSERAQITDSTLPTIAPIWSPDGEWLLYTTAVNGERYDLTALNLKTKQVHLIPEVQGVATSWRASSEPLPESDFTQGPKMTGLEVDPTVLENAYRRGSADAPVTIVEFSDYQCPFCRQWVNNTLPELESRIEDGTVQLLYVDFPLSIHPQAPAAAEAARCAGELGGDEAYWAMHDALFDSLDEWSGVAEPLPIFAQLASTSGVDGKELTACVESGRHSDEVQAGLNEGLRLGVSGTPTFIINGSRLVGAQPFEAFQPFLP
ncbi:MAG: PD40 domain-containing protein [Ardenticatenales bacterium]|nr:PD40 domain-containing protein [Ardenticatenales bacterium]